MLTRDGDKERIKILIVAERENRDIASATFGLLDAGRELAKKSRGLLCTVVLGDAVGGLAQEIANFSDRVYCLDNPLLASFQSDSYLCAMEQFCRSLGPSVILMSHTIDNLDLAPRLAYRMGVELITDCVQLDMEPATGCLLCTKPVYGDNALATFIAGKQPQMATLRTQVREALEQSNTKGEIFTFEVSVNESRIRTELVETVIGESVRLDKADAIVAGGRGIKKSQGLKQLDELIEALGKYFHDVELGASRPLIDAGWVPPSRQLGLTGEKVKPELYIAIGISGALQHLTGIFGSKKIVAINNDPGARIFNYADFGVVDDFEDVLPALVKKLRESP